MNWIEDEVGPIRILINNAGIQHRVPLLELDEANWEQVLRVNLTGAFLVGREVARHASHPGPREDHQYCVGAIRAGPTHDCGVHDSQRRAA